MKKQRKTIELARLQLNEGQLDWLPRNPRQWTKEDIEKTKASLKEDPDFLEDRPVLVVPSNKEGRFVVFAHNLCTHSAKELAWKDVPAVIYYPESDNDHLTIKRRAIKDNGSYGSNDYDILANEWDDMPLADWGVSSWVTGDASYQKEPKTDGGSRAAGTKDVSGDPHICAVQVTLDSVEEQMELFAELEGRGYKVQIV